MAPHSTESDTPVFSPSSSPENYPFDSPVIPASPYLPSPSGERDRSWSLSNDGYYPVTPPTEEASEDELADTSGLDETIPADAEPVVAVIGVGYVGEHLVSNFARKYDVLGYDVSEARIRHLEEAFGPSSRAKFTCKPADLASATHYLISVPTLLRPDQTVDTSFLRSAIHNVSKYGRAGATVVIESSVAVGMTRDLLGPLAEDRRFFAGMSPERVDPGRTVPPAHEIPKIVSGLDDMVPGSLDAIIRLYERVFDRVVRVSRPEVAEMMKLYENCQRMMCIAFANEMADACAPHGIDPYEVCGAASSKPFGYMPYTPSLGVGGHCIPVNPYYLLSNSEFPLLQAATEKMRARPTAIARKIAETLCCPQPGKSAADAAQDGARPRVLVVGMGFKRGQSHLANSPGLDLAKSLVLTGQVDVAWADPLVKQEAVPQIRRLDDAADWNAESLRRDFDMVAVAYRQEGLDFDVLGCLGDDVKVEMWCN